MALATIKDVSGFFRAGTTLTLGEFSTMWKALTDTDKYHLRKGIGDGTFDYNPNETAPETASA